jgi:hypothetical protein
MSLLNVSDFVSETSQIKGQNLSLKPIKTLNFQNEVLNLSDQESFSAILDQQKAGMKNDEEIKEDSDTKKSNEKEINRYRIRMTENNLFDCQSIEMLSEEVTFFDVPEMISQQLPLDRFGVESSVNTEFLIDSSKIQNKQNLYGNYHDQELLVKEDTYELSPTDDVFFDPKRLEQQVSSATNGVRLNQQPDMAKFSIATSSSVQNFNPLITPILISNVNLASEFYSDLAGEVGAQDSLLFVYASSQEKQLLNQENGANTNSGKSFSGDTETSAEQITTKTADTAQKTLLDQKMIQIFREHINKANLRNSINTDTKVLLEHPTLGNVDVQLSVRDNKVSAKFFGKTENMRNLLRQNITTIESILTNADLQLDTNPILVLSKGA